MSDTSRGLLAAVLSLAVLPAGAEFGECRDSWQAQARHAGLSSRVIEQIIPQLKPQPRVIELDRRQPEFTSTFADYLGRRVTETRIERGQQLLQSHSELLDKLTRQYGVPGRFLVAFWGLETNFGSYLGDTPSLDALATLACDTRRGDYFTAELLQALALIERHDLEPARMRGSWAGAMGHTQFMPSNYARYGVDGDGDGRIDLWGSIPDALTSAANFLQQLGWEPEMRWGREVRLPAGFDYSLAGRGNARPLRDWAGLGVRHAEGGRLPVADFDAALIIPAGHEGPAFLVYRNFRIIMRWNNSEFYALSVGLLADRLIGAPPLRQPPPQDNRRISIASIKALQARLNELGFDAGKPDGIIGPGTRQAIAAFQASREMIADGYHSGAVFSALDIDPDSAGM